MDDLGSGGFTSVATRPRLGITVQDVASYPEDVARRLDLPDAGVAVVDVQPGSGAEAAGIRPSTLTMSSGPTSVPVPEDVIVGADGREVDSASDLQSIVFAKRAGDVVTLEIVRSGERIVVDVEVRVVPEEPQDEEAP